MSRGKTGRNARVRNGAFGRGGARGILSCCIFAACLAAGCERKKALPAADVATLNAELAQMESRLSEKLSALAPAETAEACRYAEAALAEGERLAAGLPGGDADELASLSAALAQFRAGASVLAGDVAEAVRTEKASRKRGEVALARLREIQGRFAEEVAPRLPEWTQTQKETLIQLESLRRQRLEKIENAEFATFPAFHSGEEKLCREWDAWAEEAGVFRETVRGELYPAAKDAAETLTKATETVCAVRKRAEQGLGKIRQIPVSRELIAAARTAGIETYNKTIRGAAAAMAGMEKGLVDHPTAFFKRLDKFTARVDALRGSLEASGEAAYGKYLGVGEKAGVASAAKRAEETTRKLRTQANDFTARREALRRDWKPLGERVADAAAAAEEVRKKFQADEKALAGDLSCIGSLQEAIENADIAGRCAGLAELREKTERMLSQAEESLEKAEKAFGTAQESAVARALEVTKKSMRDSLGKLLAEFDKPPVPGWTRAEDEIRTLRSAVKQYLARMDSMQLDDLAAEGEKWMQRAKEVASKTRWTPGARHPEHPHIHASDEEWTWTNDPGYAFVEPGTSNLDVQWKTGLGNTDHPNVVSGALEGTWEPKPGYKARWHGDLDPVWTRGTRHPTRAHIFADVENGKQVWNADPGYRFVEPNSYNLDVQWAPGRGHPGHPNVTSGQEEGTWVPDAGYTVRWKGDMDPRWTPGTRHPEKPHVFAVATERTWDADPGYWFVHPGTNSDLTVRWEPGRRHPYQKGIEASVQEGRWDLLPGWTWVHPGTSDLSTRWVPGAAKPGAPHVHASDTAGTWVPDDGYEFRSLETEGDFSVVWTPGQKMRGVPHVHAGQKEGTWTPDDGYKFRSMEHDGDFSVVWTPGLITSDGMRRATWREGQFERNP